MFSGQARAAEPSSQAIAAAISVTRICASLAWNAQSAASLTWNAQSEPS
jgi:hypothetical protein